MGRCAVTQKDAPDPANDNGGDAPREAAPCAICGKPQTPKNKPFCSPRCADIDLGRWLNGSYAIPAVDDDDDEDGVSSSHEG
jgi:endogenous inhibitor of DNA gyrase (YacG/DUF329 family)